ncbi:MAG: DUF721 domain-containing protein [Methylococcaceae bacterium]
MAQKPVSFKPSGFFQNRTISYFYSQVAQQKQILQRIQAILPEALAKQARHCIIKDKKLLVYTDSAIWASQLRFYHKIMLASISTLTREPVEIVQIKVMTTQTGAPLTSSRKANIPSAETIAIIQNHCQSVSDNQLKIALLRLSSTLKRLSGKP